jgi:DNA replication protein DnaC
MTEVIPEQGPLTPLPYPRRDFLKAAKIPPRFAGLRMEDLVGYKSEDIETCKQFVRDVRDGINTGVGLLLHGAPGHGKTTIAVVTLMEALLRTPYGRWSPEYKSGWFAPRPGYFTTYPRLLSMQQRLMSLPHGDEERETIDLLVEGAYGRCIEPIWNIQVLVLDDLGKEHATASRWAEHAFDLLLRSRYDAGFPTIVTTNVPPEEWGQVYGESMMSFGHEALVPLCIVSRDGDRRQ